jgi:hypothetical protein
MEESMKKIIMVLVVVLSAKVAFGQSIEVGYTHVLDSTRHERAYATYFKMGIPIEYKFVTVEPFVSQKTWFDYDKGFQIQKGRPFIDIYGAGLRATFKEMFYVEFYHECMHDVVSDYHVDEKNNRTPIENTKTIKNRWDRSLSTVTFGFKHTFYSVKLD